MIYLKKNIAPMLIKDEVEPFDEPSRQEMKGLFGWIRVRLHGKIYELHRFRSDAAAGFKRAAG